MKKNVLLFILLLSSSFLLKAQRIIDMTIEGVPSCVPFAAFNPTNNSTTAIGDGQIVYPAGTDLSNVTVTLTTGADVIIEEPVPLPTNWTSTVTGIKVVSTSTGSWALYNITAKIINPAPLPIEIKTGTTGNFNSSSWTPSTLGWAAACIDKDKNTIRFGSLKRSFVVAFTDQPDSLYFTPKFSGTDWETNTYVFDVDGSPDGVNWTSIVQYNKENPMPGTVVGKKLDKNYRYIRWIYTTRGGSGNVTVDNVKVTKDLSNSIKDVYTDEFKEIVPALKANYVKNSLEFQHNELISKVSVLELNGCRLINMNGNITSLDVSNLISGMYLVNIQTTNGKSLTYRFVKE